MKKHIRLFPISIILILLSVPGCTSPAPDSRETTKNTEYKNIIVMVPDGCSMSIQTFARLYKGSDINLDKLHVGSVRTFAANSIITDSAAAATAFATGHKTTSGSLSVGPELKDILPIYKSEATPFYPLATILEGAKQNGKSTGLVVTSTICHATPGGFSSHVPHRMMYDDIMEQIVYQDIDVAFGGGARHLLPENDTYMTSQGILWKGGRKDSENLIKTLIIRGYNFITSRDELETVNNNKIWGVFNEKDLVPDIDRDELNPSQPSLAEMTKKAIDILSKNEKGFFLLVEGSQVDYAGHANDPVFMVTEFLAFDKAVGVVVDYAKKDPDTLVVIFPDHDTGGLAIGNTNPAASNYASTPLDTLLSPVKNAEITIRGLDKLAFKDNKVTAKEIQDIFSNKWKISLDDTQATEILNFKDSKKFEYDVGDYISRNFTILGWTSGGHTGVDVPLWAYSGRGESPLKGNIDNTEIAIRLAKVMNIDLDALGAELFVDAGSVFPDYVLSEDYTGYTLEIGKTRIPVNKDIVLKDGKEFRTEGITIYAPNINKVFIPKEAVEIIQEKE